MPPQADPLVIFLYMLMRDHLPAGEIESAMEAVRTVRRKEARQIEFSAQHLANYAIELAEELRR